MIDFAPGMRTIIRDEEWMVKKIETNSLGNKTLYCVGISPLVKDREAIFLTDLEEIQIVDPAEVKLVADTSPFYKRALLYLESQWRQQIPTDANLHIGHKAAMDLMPYQLDPAKLALQRPRQRILIADTVGLGKTLEAGILMSELIARGKGKRILVVTVKSMMTQFQKEMWNRFTIPLVRLDSNRIQKIRANLPSNYNPFFYYDKTIVSIDTLKRDVEYRTHLENAYWDIIVIDEAQNVAERGDHQAQRSRLAKLLADRSDTMIMLSATPHDGRAKSFASLMNMLDPTAIADPQNYTPEDIKGLCIRRFKKDVKDQVSGSFLERKITLERCNASAKEEYAFDIFAEMQLEMDLGKTKGTGQLFKTSLEKSLFSSPAACIKSIEARLKKLYKKYTADDIKDIHLLENLKTALEAITPADFTRYQKLLDLIRSKEYAWNPADSGDRVVIFTERIETMKYLAERLRKDLGLKANAIQEISGGMSDAEQQRIVEDFGRTESPVRVLVASDVASEGLNLHYLSHRLIHFDIPWSLMVFQQRNGRIDRYGQQNRPDIRYMLIESDNKRIKGDMRIIEILITKEEQALKNIGDPSLLLGKFTIEDEELVVAETIESGSDSDAFEQTLDAGEDDFDPFEALMAAAGKEEDEDEKKSEIHWMIADKEECIVVESMKDGMHIYDDPVGVLTNNPPFPGQMFALNNYAGVSRKQPESTFAGVLELDPYSRGMGGMGIPGDLSSQSRFVKVAFTKLNAISGDGENESVSQFFHILGSVDQQRGCCEVSEGAYEITIYTSCCNTTKGIYYYTTYDNHQITAVDMYAENLDSDKLIRYPIILNGEIRWHNKK